jgi:hypothetical protein
MAFAPKEAHGVAKTPGCGERFLRKIHIMMPFSFYQNMKIFIF